MNYVYIQEAILVNASRGPVIDEAALIEHLKANPMFRVGLDVFEVSHCFETSVLVPKYETYLLWHLN